MRSVNTQALLFPFYPEVKTLLKVAQQCLTTQGKPMSFESQFCALSVAICCQSLGGSYQRAHPLESDGSEFRFRVCHRPCVRFRSHNKAEMTPPSGAHLEMGGFAEMAAVFLRVRSTQARSKTKRVSQPLTAPAL